MNINIKLAFLLRNTLLLAFIGMNAIMNVSAQNFDTRLLSSDNGDGTYTNPILRADYPDPDIIRVGEDYYMVSSSFVIPRI